MTKQQILDLTDEQFMALSKPLLKTLFHSKAFTSKRTIITKALNRKESK